MAEPPLLRSFYERSNPPRYVDSHYDVNDPVTQEQLQDVWGLKARARRHLACIALGTVGATVGLILGHGDPIHFLVDGPVVGGVLAFVADPFVATLEIDDRLDSRQLPK